MTARNAFEAEARGRKTAALCRAISRDVRLDPEIPADMHPGVLAEFVRSRDAAWWREISRRHGIRTPSAATIEAVCLELEARAEEDAPDAEELEEMSQW